MESEKNKEDQASKTRKEPYRNWFLFLGIISGIAIGLAAGSILINRDSEKTYLEERSDVITRQDRIEEELSLLIKKIQTIQENNAGRDKEIAQTKENLSKGLDAERTYLDEKRIRIWQEIDRINEELENQRDAIDDLESSKKSSD